ISGIRFRERCCRLRKGPAFVAIHVPARRVGSAALAAVLLAALAAGLGLLPDVLPAAVPGVLGNVAPGGAAPAAAGPPAEAAPLRADTPVYRVPVDEQLVAFAVNLDWGGELLPDMLAVLDRYGARATLFPTARFAALEPEPGRGLVRAAHGLGNPGWRPDAPVDRVPVDEQLVACAVNLGWGGELLPDMRAVLDRYGARVTFFPPARFAELEPELVRGLVRAGHELGNHGWRHDHPKALDDAALRDHIVLARQRLKELTGVETKLYAPPYGEVDARIARIAAGTDHWTVMWTIDTVDWRRPAPEVIV